MTLRFHFVPFALLLSCGILSAACASSTPAPTEPPPPLLPEPEGGTMAPSSSSVGEAIEYLEAEKFKEAEAILMKEVALAPEDPQVAYYLGVAKERLGDLDAAMKYYRKAIELQPKLIEASVNLSSVARDKGEFTESLAVADAALKLAPTDAGLLRTRAYTLDEMRSEEALPAFVAALEVSPEDMELRFYYAQALYYAERLDEAKAELAKIPSSGEQVALTNLVALYSRMGDFAGCIKLLDTSIAQASSVELLIRRAGCKLGAKDQEGAEADFRAAVAADPNSADGHFYLARYLAQTGAGEEATLELQKAVEVGPETPSGKAAARTLAKGAKREAN